jgi:hypothetical protein
VKATLDNALAERWAEYERLRDGGEPYSAAIRLAELENCLQYQRIQKPVRHKWEAKVCEAESEQDVGRVLAGAVAAMDRLHRMLSIGTDYVYEELMLLITIRVELDLLFEFLAKRGAIDAIASRLGVLDEELLEIAHSEKHRTPFSKAQAGARGSWGIPLETRWLGGRDRGVPDRGVRQAEPEAEE